MALGMAPLRHPSTQVGQSAVIALASISSRGHPAHHLVGDRAYTQAKPEHFQLPARALGYKPVLDYKITQLGRQGSYAGMGQVDGSWYCPGMPELLIMHIGLPEGRYRRGHSRGPGSRERRNYEMRPWSVP